MSKIKTLAGAVLATTLTAGLSTSALAAAGDPVKIGVMLPFSGIYAQLGEAGRDGLKLALKEHAEKLHGSKVEFIELNGLPRFKCKTFIFGNMTLNKIR